MGNEWDISFIPTLLNTIVQLNQRLADEQRNARNILKSCERGHYWSWSDIEEEDDRLRDNVNKCEERKKIYQDLLVEFAKDHTKDESKQST